MPSIGFMLVAVGIKKIPVTGITLYLSTCFIRVGYSLNLFVLYM